MAKQVGIPSVPGGSVMLPPVYGGQLYPTEKEAADEMLKGLDFGQRMSVQRNVPVNADAVDMENSYIQMLNEQIQQNTDYDKSVTDSYNANNRYSLERKTLMTPGENSDFTPWSTGSHYVGSPMQSKRGEFMPYERPEFVQQTISAGKANKPAGGGAPPPSGVELVDFDMNGKLTDKTKVGMGVHNMYGQGFDKIKDRANMLADNYTKRIDFDANYGWDRMFDELNQKAVDPKFAKDFYNKSYQALEVVNGKVVANPIRLVEFDGAGKNSTAIVSISYTAKDGKTYTDVPLSVQIEGAWGLYPNMSPKAASEQNKRQIVSIDNAIKEKSKDLGGVTISKGDIMPKLALNKLTAMHEALGLLYDRTYGDQNSFYDKFKNYAYIEQYHPRFRSGAKAMMRESFIRTAVQKLIERGRK